LTANVTLRRLVQRKLNRCWSPDEVCGWLRKTYPDDPPTRLAGSRQVVARTVGVNPSRAVPRAR
jgi:IS30 family transposase